MDQLAELQMAVNTSPIFNGQGATYEIAGDLVLPDGALLSNINLVQLDPSATRRSASKIGGWIRGLENVSVDRGSDKSAGSILSSAGIYLDSCSVESVLNDLEIFGHGKGVGIYLKQVHAPAPIRRAHVHDMEFSASTNPGSEQIFGIWLNDCSNVVLHEPKIARLSASIPGQNTYIQTDGITCGGGLNIQIVRPEISWCAEGIDFTGSNGNRNISVVAGKVEDCNAFGVKLANSVRNASIEHTVASRCGWSGFVVSGPVESGIPKIEDIHFIRCDAIDTGFNRNYATSSVAGFTILQGSFESSLPQNIRFYYCVARDTQADKSMKYGFRNENNNTSNILRSCTSIGHTINSVLGTWGLA